MKKLLISLLVTLPLATICSEAELKENSAKEANTLRIMHMNMRFFKDLPLANKSETGGCSSQPLSDKELCVLSIIGGHKIYLPLRCLTFSAGEKHSAVTITMPIQEIISGVTAYSTQQFRGTVTHDEGTTLFGLASQSKSVTQSFITKLEAINTETKKLVETGAFSSDEKNKQTAVDNIALCQTTIDTLREFATTKDVA